ncbi:MAG: hypothetical protein PVF59_11000, partial [Desulfobacterales bacterium]
SCAWTGTTTKPPKIANSMMVTNFFRIDIVPYLQNDRFVNVPPLRQQLLLYSCHVQEKQYFHNHAPSSPGR